MTLNYTTKTMEQNRKYTFGHVRDMDDEQRKEAEETRTITFEISSGTKDRHGTVLNPKKWNLKNYRKNPIVGYQHELYGSFFSDSNPDNVIGKSKVYLDGAKEHLLADVTFEPEDINPLAEKIFKKIMFGTLRSASVGFIPDGEGKYGKDDEAEGEKNQTYYYGGQELLEWSVVNIPSNPNANKRGTSKEEALQFFDKAINELLGDNYDEKLTVKGIRNILGAEPEVREEGIEVPIKKEPEVETLAEETESPEEPETPGYEKHFQDNMKIITDLENG